MSMNNYVIFTDSACDLPREMTEEWGVCRAEIGVSFDGGATVTKEMSAETFYATMRAGGVAKTAAMDADTLTARFAEEAEKGNDVLYLALSSGLSDTCFAGQEAMQRLAARYPERRFATVDTLSASGGYGLLVSLAVQKKQRGADMGTVIDFVEETRLRICHWFTVDDSAYLRRGGRMGKTAAFVGNVLGIKPVLHMDDMGRLVNMFKVRGRKHAVAALADAFGEAALASTDTVYISHADCAADAEALRTLLMEKYGTAVPLVTEIGPVVGAHAGPGTLAIFFVGKQR